MWMLLVLLLQPQPREVRLLLRIRNKKMKMKKSMWKEVVVKVKGLRRLRLRGILWIMWEIVNCKCNRRKKIFWILRKMNSLRTRTCGIYSRVYRIRVRIINRSLIRFERNDRSMGVSHNNNSSRINKSRNRSWFLRKRVVMGCYRREAVWKRIVALRILRFRCRWKNACLRFSGRSRIQCFLKSSRSFRRREYSCRSVFQLPLLLWKRRKLRKSSIEMLSMKVKLSQVVKVLKCSGNK